MATVAERVIALITNQLKIKNPADVVLGATLVDDLRADSLDLVDLMIAVEEAFEGDVEGELKITDEDAAEIKTVQDVIKALKAKGVKDKVEA